MAKRLPVGLAVALVLALSGCASKDGWKGAEAERQYDQDLKQRRLAEGLNNDDYWELHRDGRIYVLTDPEAYRIFRQTDEIPLVVTLIGAGPAGETVKLGLLKDEAKAMEKKVGYKGAAQRLFEGEIQGLSQGFYGELHKDGVIYVFGDWAELTAFRKSGETALAAAETGPNGEKLMFVGKGAAPDVRARFARIHAR